MIFAHDTEVALAAAAALVNTGSDTEELRLTWPTWTGSSRTGGGPARAPTTRPNSTPCGGCGPGWPSSGN